MVVGIHKKEPSSRGGINSLPSPGRASARAAKGAELRMVGGTKPKTREKPSHADAPASISNKGKSRTKPL